jgi:uncharacterized protein (DUF2267 family)
MSRKSGVRSIAWLVIIGAVAAAAVAARRQPRRPEWLRHVGDVLKRPVQRAQGGLLREARHEMVDDVVVADRVRSHIGPLLKEFDTPRVHVMAEGSRVLLHGEVVDEQARSTIEKAVRQVDGVSTVASYLSVGLLAGEARPSAGHHEIPSRANRLFHDALQHAGLAGRPAELALVEALRGFTDTLPEGERAHVLAHLPRDVRSLMSEQHTCSQPLPVDDAEDLIARVEMASGLKRAESALAVRTVVGELALLVPEECDDVYAVLRPGLRGLWKPAVVNS